ncbi:hypothetical protein NMY22_g17273 [Coprinellus aureogranulatus]|nr:hypothetical protein NMY22_g17273 [Coprinellus aureogranulatus]
MSIAIVTPEQRSIGIQIELLKRQWNSLSPIARVPPEVVSEILLLATLDAKAADEPTQRTKSCIKTLCHVCQTWRAIALDYPRLWTAIDVLPRTKARKLRFFATRAKNLPISLYINLGPGGRFMSAEVRGQVVKPKALKTVTKLIIEKELSSLTFNGSIVSLAELLPSFPQGPSLQAIHVKLDQPLDEWQNDGVVLTPRNVLIQKGYLGLRVLSLTGCTLPLTSPVLLSSPHLADLSLNVPKGSRIWDIIRTLRKVPQLQQLCLRMPHPFRGRTGIPHRMHFLRKLRICRGFITSHYTEKMHKSRPSCDNSDYQQPVSPLTLVSSIGRFSPRKLEFGSEDWQFTAGDGYSVSIEHQLLGGGSRAETLDCRTTVIFRALDQESVNRLDCARWFPLAVVPTTDDHETPYASNLGWSAAELRSIAAFGGVDYTDVFWRRISTYPKLTHLVIGGKEALDFPPYLLSERKIMESTLLQGGESEYFGAKDPLIFSPNTFNEHDIYPDNGERRYQSFDIQGHWRDESEEQEDRTLPFPSLQHIEVQLPRLTSTTANIRAAAGTTVDLLLESFVNALLLRQTQRPHFPASASGVESLQTLIFIDCESSPSGALVSAISSMVTKFTWKMREPQGFASPSTRSPRAPANYNSDEDESV